MKYALVDGARAESTPKSRGKCQACGADVIARCGTIKVWHWAHKSKEVCDSYWENETEWHREWKNRFPEHWQEHVLRDETTGEKHIADVRAEDKCVIEFQYSPIDPSEQKSREIFYERMVWIVNGVRRKSDYKRFAKGLDNLLRTKQQGIFITRFPEKLFPRSWLNRSVPAFFDFDGAIDANPEITHGCVWGLLPGKQQGMSVVLCVSKDQFVEFAKSGKLFGKLAEINRLAK